MGDFQKVQNFQCPMISTVTVLADRMPFTAQAAAVWPLANLAFFIPFNIPGPTTVIQMFWVNGTVGTDSADVGIYDSQGNRLVSSGSTALAGATNIQAVNTTDIVLEQGTYYLAMAMSGTTNTVGRFNPPAPQTSGWGVLEMTAAFPLPATATFATSNRAYMPVVGGTSQAVL